MGTNRPPIQGLALRLAGPDDASAVSGLLQERARWLLARGINQWREEWFSEEWANGHIQAGTMYIAEVDGAPAGTLRLIWEDPGIWGERPADAGYVHSLSASPDHPGLGRQMLNWAGGRAAAEGREFLRLDCWSGNAPLRAHYESLGFTHQGDVEQHGVYDRNERWFVSRYERNSAS